MIKKRAQSNKKKVSGSSTPNTKFQKVGNTVSPQKILMRFTGGFLGSKPSLNSQILSKGIKSGSATPSSKIKKQSKQNMYQSIFYTKKTSETMTPFDYDQKLSSVRTRADFKFVFQIGSGGFGRVWKVEEKKNGKIYAMKEMSKSKIIAKKSVVSIMNEKQLLDQLQNPFIINSCESFQDRDYLYLVMQYLRGGDLRYHMCFYECFDEEQTKFIVSCIILALQYIHSCKIIHRDLKPENIVFDQSGYASLTDFGVARKKKNDNGEETSGTPGYMAPEVICRMNHSFEADYFALGVIVYELIFGMRPYVGDSRKEIRQKILSHQAKINEKDLPSGWNPTCIDFVNRLIKRNKQSRLGYNGISQIKNHPWLKTMNWQKLAKKQLRPPFCPGVICESKQYQMQMEMSSPSQFNQQASMLLRTKEIQKIFAKYDIKTKTQKLNQKISTQLSGSKLMKKVL